MKNNQKSFAGIVLVALFAIIVFLVVSKTDQTKRWKTFENNMYQYEIKYPEDFELYHPDLNSDIYLTSNVTLRDDEHNLSIPVDSQTRLKYNLDSNTKELGYNEEINIWTSSFPMTQEETLLSIAQSRYNFNKNMGYATSDIKEVKYNENLAYEFIVDHGYGEYVGYELPIYYRTKVVFLADKKRNVFRITFPQNSLVFQKIFSTFKFTK
ncbi:hypothetical protein A3A95_01865 [Candidatus Nomurabacteria bacterium RIFCSPLOWO2_01_FULL_39_18]|uniref:PsbP C-terminal domain-containing protein n=1 Tax=Candidatus Nomurabacteria bacterium RIFCSPHIGHO2_01_FULL_40_24b TaxID=1801739 RepID=A0A1F6V9I0_9BACT|nr:MAG: hypothetical protein A2647_00855 [Candidatus Nomurabacteria bacterium RIFCSPHIGHO2_01_FULL_40_24b]OGI90611.1 MAG: hypothetical protein A3A95_01865 [Candidatus Nomurabacteria bacterium RIFCSPLOWO2_01_FULL_39_18]